jgi:hypothetical protein
MGDGTESWLSCCLEFGSDDLTRSDDQPDEAEPKNSSASR